MSEMLKALGIGSQTQKNYNTQFGITLNKRTPQIIVPSGGQKLLADEVTQTPFALTDTTADPAQVSQIMTDFDVQPGETELLIMDVGDGLPLQAQTVLVAAATTDAQLSDKLYGTLGVCFPVSTAKGESFFLSPADAAEGVFVDKKYPLAVQNYPAFVEFAEQMATAEVVQQPTYGTLEKWEQSNDKVYGGRNVYKYTPNGDYKGNDKAVFLVTLGEHKVKVVFFFKVINTEVNLHNHEQINRKYCPKSTEWVISSGTSDWPSWTSSIVPWGDLNNVKVTFADLAGTAIGETMGEGKDAIITLDKAAAGYNWFIDTTPADNDEFLPTSNPNEWVAKAGSAAEGKMDLLSVLLHEYGHALGIEHSADSGDYMAATLQPGVRRLPSSDELALMAQLVNGLRTGQDNAPVNPSLPIGTTLGALLLGRLRRTDYGTWSPVFDSAQITTPAPQFDTAANPKLQNQEFDDGDGWSTEGTVNFANGAATLVETAGNQTRLNQVFVLGEHDRFLSFTLANTALGDQAGPDDAFEVALLDANTGHSLLGGTGLSRNDAFLNLQANGKEYKASGITRLDNADGSRTYLVDLSGIAAGTTVNLAFDLIGFGQGLEAVNSRLTIRDLRLGVPQATDDSAALAEDTPAVIDALANDLDARQPGFAPVVVEGPAHGQVTVNADGSFSFTPEADWYGEDHFTYKLSDGRVDSNIATVTLTVTAVNDVPVAADTKVAVEEDASVTINLVALVSDVDSGTFMPAIVNGPTHGSLSQNADGSFTYKPNADYNGADSFTYKVSDGELDSNLATVTFSVTPVNDAPLAQDGSLGLIDKAAKNKTAPAERKLYRGSKHGLKMR